MATANQTPRVAPKANGNGATVAPKAKAKRARAAKGKPTSGTNQNVKMATKTKPYVNELGILDKLAPQATADFKASDMKPIDSATADKNIATIRMTGNKTRRLAHVTAVGILLHYATNGDWSKLTKLDSAIGESISRQMQRGFRQWVARFSTVQWRETKDSKGKLTFAGYVDSVKGEGMEAKRFNLTGDKSIDEKDADKRLDREGALNNPFWSRNFGDTEPRDHTFDFDKEFARFAARILNEYERREKLLKEKNKRAANKIKVDEKEVNAIKSLAKTLHIKLVEAAPAGNA